MLLTRLAIQRPLLVGLVSVALCVAGIVAGSRLPVDLNPQADLATITVLCVVPGASPTTIESLVAKPLEEALRPVPQLRHLGTISQDSALFAYAEFEIGSDSETALANCREALANARQEFPANMQDPLLAKLDINAQPVLFLGLAGDRELDELRALAKDVVEPRLRAVPGVTAVEVIGGERREVAVEVDRVKLLGSGLTLSRLTQIVQAANMNVPGGTLEEGDRARGVRLVGALASLDELRAVSLPPADDPRALIEGAMRPRPPHQPQRALRLGDIAGVRVRAVPEPVRVRLGGQPAVGLIVTKRGDGNTIRVARDATEAALSAPLPADVHIEVARDQAQTVSEALSDVTTSLVLGILLCAWVVGVFLRDRWATLIVVCTIPICLLGALAPMSWAGNTLNQMTLLGLALSIGILVDDSIVCIEAIIQRLRAGEPPAEAAFHGRNDIALADTSTTLIDFAVFIPIAVMAGTVGQFFRDFGFVIAVVAGLSLLAAYTVVPSLATLIYARRPPAAGALDDSPRMVRLQDTYARALEWALRHRRLTLGAGWAALAGAGLLAWAVLPIDLIPAADLGTLAINVEMPAGSSFEATESTVAEIERLLADIPELGTTFATIGRVEIGFGVVSRVGPRQAQLNISLLERPTPLDYLLLRAHKHRRRSDDDIAAEVRERLRAVPGATIHVIAVHGWGGSGAPVDFSLYGRDVDRLGAAGAEILARLDRLPSLLNPDLAWRLGEPELQVEIEPDRAREYYVYAGQVANELRTAVAGTDAGNLELGEQTLPIRVRLRPEDRRSETDIARLPVGPGPSRPVMISDVARLQSVAGPTRIDRRDGQRDLNIKAYLAPDVSLGHAQADIERVLAEVGVPREGSRPADTDAYRDLRWGWRGDASTMAESTKYLAGTALVGIILTYLVMAVLFNSALHPFTIMLSVPMAGTGGLLLLAAWGSSLSIVSGIGFILLIGIVVRNAILLLDYTFQQRAEGVPRHDAVVAAGRRRLRPIIMTTLTTVVGMLPVALGLGAGAEVRSPMAVAVIGGLLLSTLLTLIIIPVTYTVLDDWVGGRTSQATDTAPAASTPES